MTTYIPPEGYNNTSPEIYTEKLKYTGTYVYSTVDNPKPISPSLFGTG